MTETDLKPRARRHAQTQEAILDAARHLIRERGVDGLSMRAIADRIDYSAAGLYEYFESKEAIIGAVCAQGHQRLTAAMSRVDPALPAEEYLVGIGLAYIGFALRDPDYFNLMFSALSSSTAAGRMEEDSSYLYLLRAVRRGIEEEVFITQEGYDEQTIIYHAWVLVHGIATLRTTVFREDAAGLDQADQAVLRAFVRGLSHARPV
jgi:AcrR family transcriptional regulator